MGNTSSKRSAVKALRIDKPTAEAIARLGRHAGRSFSSLASEMLQEAAKMRRCPGIVFADGPVGRRARIEGTGIEVWELVGSFLALGKNERRLARAYGFLSDRQRLAALGYYRAYPAEIEAQLESNREAPSADELPFARRLAR